MTEPSLLFPYEVRLALIAASKIKDERERLKRLEKVTEWAKAKYPAYFRKQAI